MKLSLLEILAPSQHPANRITKTTSSTYQRRTGVYVASSPDE